MSLNSGIEKLYAAEGYVTTSVKISCLTVPKNAVGEPFCHCLILGIESLVKRGGGEEEGSITIFCRKLLFHNAGNFCRGALLCRVSEKFRQRKCLWIRMEGYQGFPSEIFCPTLPKTFVEEPFCAVFQKISGSQKVYG